MAIQAKVSAAFFPEPGLVVEPEPQHMVALHSIAVVSRVGSCATEPQVAASEIVSICEARISSSLGGERDSFVASQNAENLPKKKAIY